jgi:endonuclease/exonuclease/phosphatase family metal-dependent hydrolase
MLRPLHRLNLALIAAACAPPIGPTTPADSAPELRAWTRIADQPAPDVTSDRLCAEAADPEAAPDTTSLSCRTETFRFADPSLTPGDTLRVMAFNLERGYRLDDLLAAFDRGDLPLPDLLLASELDRGCERTSSRHIARELGAHLQMDVAFGVEFVELPQFAGPGLCEHGNALLSRFPLGNAESRFHAENVSWYLPPAQRPGDEPRLGGRSFVTGEIVWHDTLLRAVSVHFESRPSAWPTVLPAQAAEAAEAAAAYGPPAIVAGDTNIPGYQFDLARADGASLDASAAAFFAQGYEDAHAALPFEQRATRGSFIIDLIFTQGLSASAPVVCSAALCDPLSDHRAIWVDLTRRSSP